MPRSNTPLHTSPDRPLILLTNDDGIDANGLAALASALDGLGDLAVVAPTQEQSAVGHAITVRDPVRAHGWPFEVPSGAAWARAVTGTPADCVKLACQKLLPRRPDLVVSGINHGPNTAVNVIYSGTVSAATEATILGIPAVAVSLCSWDPDADFEAAGRFARHLAERVLAEGLAPGTLLNVERPTRRLRRHPRHRDHPAGAGAVGGGVPRAPRPVRPALLLARRRVHRPRRRPRHRPRRD